MLKRIPVPHAFRAIRYRNFQLFFFGQFVSVTGSWMQTVAQSWLVFRLTHSSFLLGLVGFANMFPVFALSLFGGVVADRYSRRTLVTVMQSLQMLLAFILSYLTLDGIVTVNEIIVLSVLNGIVFSFEMPARQSFMIEMVEPEALPSAISMNSTAFNGARIFGPAFAALVLSVTSEGVCFLLNAISYLAVVWALLVMDVKHKPGSQTGQSPFKLLGEGIRYAYNYLPARTLLLLESVVSLMGMSYSVLMPVFAASILHRGSSGLGILMGSVGTGALVGSFYIGMRRNLSGMGRIAAISCAIFGLSSAIFAYSTNFYLSIVLLLFTGFGMFAQLTTANTMLQTLVPDDLRGRLMSLYSLVVVGLAPFGSLLSGWMAEKWGSPVAVAASGAACLAAALVFAAWIPKIRPHVRATLATLPINTADLKRPPA